MLNKYDTIEDRLRMCHATLSLQAEMAEVVAAHFRPRFEACWDKDPETGRLRSFKDGDAAAEAMRLRFHVIDQENDAKRLRRDAADTLAGAEAIAGLREMAEQCHKMLLTAGTLERSEDAQKGCANAAFNLEVGAKLIYERVTAADREEKSDG